MYSITTVFKNKGRCFVVDSKDGVSESYTFTQIRDFVEKRGLDIKGYKAGNRVITQVNPTDYAKLKAKIH